jgi:hypothetical protein
MNKTINELALFCLEGLSEIEKRDSFDYQTFYPNGEGILVQKESQGKIDDISLFPKIASLLGSTQNKEVHWWLKLILYRLLRNTKNREIGEYVIGLIEKETEFWKIKHYTDVLADNGGYSEKITNLLYLLEQANKDIRLNTIRALEDCKSASKENPLINILRTSKDYYELLYALWSIRNVATRNSLPILKKLLYHKKQDIKLCSLGAISNALKEEGCDFYIELFNDKNYRDKGAVASCIREYCNEKGVSTICGRIKTILSRKRGNIQYFRMEDGTEKTELVFNVQYLREYYSDYPNIENIFKLVKKKWEKIFEVEKEDIRQAIETINIKS